MTDRERQVLELRMLDIEEELQDIANLRVIGCSDSDEYGDPASVEEELLRQQEEIEWRLAADYFNRRDCQ